MLRRQYSAASLGSPHRRMMAFGLGLSFKATTLNSLAMYCSDQSTGSFRGDSVGSLRRVFPCRGGAASLLFGRIRSWLLFMGCFRLDLWPRGCNSTLGALFL